MGFAHIFGKKSLCSASEQNLKPAKVSTAGAHELFLEYEGFLAPSVSRPTKQSTPTTKQKQPRAAGAVNPRPATNNKFSEKSIATSAKTFEKLSNNSSSYGEVTEEHRPRLSRTSPGQKKGLFSFNRSSRADSRGIPRKLTKQSSIYASELSVDNSVSRSSWLRKCMSTNSRGLQPSPPPSFTTIPPYYEAPVFDGDSLTALPPFPGDENEAPKVPEKPCSGTAARAAVAAVQNELFDSMRNLRLAEPKLTRDSESGVGIEIRDRGGLGPDFEIPIIRKDPLSVLPEELVGQILSYLDADSLINAELVSIDWHQSASSHHVWREVFRAEFQNVCQTLTVPNASRRVWSKALNRQDWKDMWRARKALDQRWKDGHAAAIYLEGHKDSVYCVQFDDDKIITGSRDRTVRIWDAKTYECTKVLGLPSRNAPSAVQPLADTLGRKHKPFARVISPPSDVVYAPVLSNFYHYGSILCLQYDEEIMITGSSDCTLIIWDVKADYRPFMRLRRHTAGVLDVCFDDKNIVSCSKDAAICLWDRNTGSFLRKMTGHRGPVNAVQLRGELVVSASGDGIAKLWNIRSGLCIKEFPSRDRGMACVEFSPDSRTILAGGNDQVIYQFDTTTGELVRELKGHEGLVRSLHLDSSSGRIVSGSYDTSVKAFDLRTGETIVDFNRWTSSWILSAKSDYRRIIATSQDSRAVIMDFGYQLPGIDSLRT